MISVGLDTTQLDAEALVAQGTIDAVVETWQKHRTKIMMSLGIMNQMMSITTRLAAKTTNEVGKAMLKNLQGLLMVVNATVSAMVAVAAGYTSTGILAPIGAIVAGFAAGLSIGQVAAVAVAEDRLQNDIGAILRRLNTLQSEYATGKYFRGSMGVF